MPRLRLWKQTVGFDTLSWRAIAVTVHPSSSSAATRSLVGDWLSSGTPLGNGVIGSTRHSGCRSWGSSPCSPVQSHELRIRAEADGKPPFCGAFALRDGDVCDGRGSLPCRHVLAAVAQD